MLGAYEPLGELLPETPGAEPPHQVGLPYVPGGYGLVAVSTLVRGADGQVHNVLYHPLRHIGEGTPMGDDPCGAFGWYEYGSGSTTVSGGVSLSQLLDDGAWFDSRSSLLELR